MNSNDGGVPNFVLDAELIYFSFLTYVFVCEISTSAESLGAQFETLYPGSTYTLLDIHKEHSYPPYNKLVESYKHLSAHPKQWNFVYKITNAEPMESLVKTHMKVTTELTVRRKIQSCRPDVVISVHPLMNSVPVIACQKISSATGKHLPFFTVVTDLGSCHFTWFDKGVEKMFIASDQIRGLAERKEVPKEKIVMSGLPIRKDFATEAERLGQGGRTSVQGKIYQMQVRDQLGLIREQQSNLDPSMDRHRVLLVMGGGEGVGSLSDIVDSLFLELAHRKIMATIIVVCGRNEKLKNSLEKRDWNEMLYAIQARNEKSNLLNGIASLPLSVFHKLHIGKRSQNGEEKKDDERPEERSQVLVHPLGFVTNMAEYMVAADVLITKAGPGTIAEAASVGLPVMLTSFLPGE